MPEALTWPDAADKRMHAHLLPLSDQINVAMQPSHPCPACARLAATTASTLLWLRDCTQQEQVGWEHALNLCCVLCRAWHIISHPLAINPFPASYLNCRTGFTIAPVTIPGNQAFMDWKLTMLTELHAMDNMKAILGGMMRVGMLSKQSPSLCVQCVMKARLHVGLSQHSCMKVCSCPLPQTEF